ncbi:hypothetical protein [Aquabacterium sp.]|uniref:hypothetical protein n=1 Tax=Aquabacterium sp. TaxID=1872578 RepID=UPI002621D674|nr:hypothetical protein [Aquabacterium sp.]MDD2977910.1 hypothetical protein [Aquabacterium sp.]
MFYSKTTRGFYDSGIHTLIPDDAVEINHDTHAALLAGQAEGKLIVPGPNGMPVLEDHPAPTPEQMIATIAAAVQSHMDLVAKVAGYDDIMSAVTYADEPVVPKFQQDGIAFRAWRSLVWEKCYAILAQTKSGEIEPMSAEQVIAELPPLNLEAI